MKLAIGDQHVIQTSRVVRLHTEGVVHTHLTHSDLAEYTILTGETKTPVPLLANHFDHFGVIRHLDNQGQGPQTGRQNRNDTYGCDDGEPPFNFCAFRLVMRLAALTVTVFDHHPDEEPVEGNINDSGDYKRESEVAVKQRPI